MAELRLNAESSVEEIKTLLEANLNFGIVPHADPIAKGIGKGIYFWFIKVSALPLISKFVEILTFQPSVYKEIEGEKYVLVYLGTAGTGKSGGGNLTQRLNWHIGQKHSESNICHGTLSTLRAGLGSLLSDDLIILNTEGIVNKLMENSFKVYWIEYIEEGIIDSDEFILIQKLRPVLNLKNNPNALMGAPLNPTQYYKRRRALVYSNTRERIGCGSGESDDVMSSTKPIKNLESYNHQVIEDIGNCITFIVIKGQRIDKVIRGIEGLPTGHCTYAIYNSENGEEIRKGFTGSKVKVNPNAQNIYTYFTHSDSNKDSRYLNILNLMINENIEEVTVRVCKLEVL
jgi:hypothetical protein